MITFPPEFVTTKYPGYYWNTITQRLYTIKVTGELRELHKPHSNFTKGKDVYAVSYKGIRRWILVSELKALKSQTIPVAYK